MACDAKFWSRHPGLNWSNPDASDDVHIRLALLKPRFSQLLEIAVRFGLDALSSQWDYLRENCQAEASRVADDVNRCLRNMRLGCEAP